MTEIDPLWYKDAIIYELHVRAFHDSDGDGIGDFRGLTQKLDYLAGPRRHRHLAAARSTRRRSRTTATTSPTTPSVHPQYGTLDDFQEFLDAAHRRGLRVITELVINHTSDQHPWFQRARAAPPGQPRARLLRLERHARQVQGRPHHLQGLRAVQLDLGPGRRAVLLAPLLLATSPT